MFLAGEANFIKTLVNFDKDNITDRVLKKIGQYCRQVDFHPEIIGKVSLAAKSLCMWVRAMEVRGCHKHTHILSHICADINRHHKSTSAFVITHFLNSYLMHADFGAKFL